MKFIHFLIASFFMFTFSPSHQNKAEKVAQIFPISFTFRAYFFIFSCLLAFFSLFWVTNKNEKFHPSSPRSWCSNMQFDVVEVDDTQKFSNGNIKMCKTHFSLVNFDSKVSKHSALSTVIHSKSLLDFFYSEIKWNIIFSCI